MIKGTFLTIFLFVIAGLASTAEVNAGLLIFETRNQDHPEIEQMIDLGNQLYRDEEFDRSIEVYLSAAEASEKAGYSKGLTHAYIGLASAYYLKNKLDVSTSYLIKAKNQSYVSDKPDELYAIAIREGLNLHSLGLYDEAVSKYKMALEYAQRIEEEIERADKTSVVYTNIGDVFQLRNEADSALFYYKKSFYSQSASPINKLFGSASISDVYLDLNETDSAAVYLDRAKQISDRLDSGISNSFYLEVLGKYKLATGDYDEAIELFGRSQTIGNDLDRPNPELFRLISEAYSKKGNHSLSGIYLRKYVELKEQLEKEKKANLRVPVLLANTENAYKLKKAKSKTMLILAGSALFAVLSFLAFFSYLRIQKRKILKRKLENQLLKNKLNNAFDEVIELADTNSANFLSRFIEVYPEFYNRLITDYPNLTTADVKLCALIKLDYSTKEIAEKTFSSVRTIENRKYRLRKKFSLSPEDKLNRWIQTLQLEQPAEPHN